MYIKKIIQKWMSNKCYIQDVVLIALAVGTDRLALDCSTCPGCGNGQTGFGLQYLPWLWERTDCLWTAVLALAVGTDRLPLDCSTYPGCGNGRTGFGLQYLWSQIFKFCKSGAFVGQLRSCEFEERLC